MATALPTTGTLSYNGVTFTELYRTSISSQPLLDVARRTVIGIRWIIEVDAYIGNQPVIGSTDATIGSLRSQLQTAGQELHYDGKGFNPLAVNAPGGNVWDSEYGPIPEVVRYSPIGNNIGARVTWRVSTVIPECPAGTATYQFGTQAFNYNCRWSLRDGWEVRTISGYVAIPATRQPGGVRQIQDTADRLRESITPAVPTGFDRETYEFDIDYSKRQLNFTIVDRELPVNLPPFAKRIDATYTVESNLRPYGFNVWPATVAGTIHTPAGEPKSVAFSILNLLLFDRFGMAPNKPLEVPLGTADYLVDYSITDEMFGTATHFRMSARFIVPLSLLISQSGLWQVVAGADDYFKWANSLGPLPWSPRGNAGQGILPSDDTIIDLCVTAQPTTILTPGTWNPLPNGPVQPGPGSDIGAILRAGGVGAPHNNWLEYECRILLAQDMRRVRHKPLADPLSGTPDLIQTISPPTYDVWLVGHAVRWGLPVPIPDLIQLAGNTNPQETDRFVEQWEEGAFGGYLVYGARWAIRYMAPSDPVELPIPPSPILESGLANILTTGVLPINPGDLIGISTNELVAGDELGD